MKRCVVLFVLVTAATLSFGQQVYIRHSGDDFVGVRFAYAVKEQLRKSASYTVVDSGQVLTVELVSLDISDGSNGAIQSGLSSVISILFTIPTDEGNLNISHSILIVGGKKVDEMASSLVATLDKNLSETRAMFKKATSERQPNNLVKEH